MRRNLLIGAVALILATLVAGWIFVGAPLRAQAMIGTGYGAKYVCGCLFVSQIGEDTCRADLGEEMASISLSVDRTAQTVTAWVPLIATAVARHESGFGCTLD